MSESLVKEMKGNILLDYYLLPLKDTYVDLEEFVCYWGLLLSEVSILIMENLDSYTSLFCFYLLL